MNAPAPKTTPDAALGNLMAAALDVPAATEQSEVPAWAPDCRQAADPVNTLDGMAPQDVLLSVWNAMQNAADGNDLLSRLEHMRGSIARAAYDDTQTAAARDVFAERRRQILAEGWSTAHDDEHDAGDMAAAGAAYALNAADVLHPFSQGDGGGDMPDCWPWASVWWKPSTPRRDLVKACALILAEIERIDRAEADALQGEGGAA